MDRQEVINIFAQEMAKTQKKADNFIINKMTKIWLLIVQTMH